MLSRKSVVDQVEIQRSGAVSVRMALLICDGDMVISSRTHRTTIPAGESAAVQMAEVNTHLAGEGEATISAEDIAWVCQCALVPPAE